ncbi:MAG: hypothetical protein ACLP1X_06365 [Polyangiaceae bacterium]
MTARPLPWRTVLLPVASTAYVAAVAIRADHGYEPRAWLVGLGAITLVLVASRRSSRLVRAVGWGFGVLAASLAAEGEGRALDAFSAIGVFACAAAACVAVSRMTPEGGLVEAARPSPAPVVSCLGVAWFVAAIAPVVPADREPGSVVGARATVLWIATAVSVVGLWAFTEWTAHKRRLELGVVARLEAIRVGLVAIFFVAAFIAGFGRASPQAVAEFALACAAATVTAAALHEDAVRVSRAARRVAVLAIACGGVALLGASAADGSGNVWTVTLISGLLCAAIGSAARTLEAPLRPARGAWLDAFARACESSVRPEAEDAIRDVLMALRAPAGLEAPSPELWTFAPTRSSTVDAAGYLHEEEATFPEALLLFAVAEPEATLRAEVLDAREVRLPELRPLARWMTARGAMLATVVACEGDTEGLLVLPRGARQESPTLEEIRELKRVADHLAAACRARAGQLRMLERGRDATARVAAIDQRLERLLRERALDTGRDALAAVRLARPATIGVYSAASRLAFEQLEMRTAADGSIALVAPSGVDPVPYIARAHLGGTRRDAPLVLVDCTSAREHDIERWADPGASPLALAHRGLLVLLDAAALPPEVQQLVARACTEMRAPWERPEPIDVRLALTGVASPDRLVAEGRLDPALALRLGDARVAPIVLPRLRDRPEDLRAILTDRLAREGLRVLGRPVGIDHAAYARLVDHSFPGEDAELAAIVQRLVASVTGDVVRASDVDALHLPEERRRKDPLSA